MTRPSRSKIFRSHQLERSSKSTSVTYNCVTTVDPTNAKSIKQVCVQVDNVKK